MSIHAVTPDTILDFWFDRRLDQPPAPRAIWWRKDAAFDDEIRRRFGEATAVALGGGFEEWAGTTDGLLALVILLDQFPRNLFRGQARAFAGDDRARALARIAIDRGADIGLPPPMRIFLYLPFEHSEQTADQDLAHLLFSALDKELPEQKLLDFAERHRAIIARFGRFPHRNAALGRDSTPEETEFLKQPGSSF